MDSVGRTVRPSGLDRTVLVLGMLFFGFLGLVRLGASRSSADVAINVVCLVLAVFSAWSLGWVRLVIRGDGVVIYNVLSVRRLSYGEIADVEPSYWGLTFALRNSEVVRAAAVNKPKSAQVRGRRTRADDIADEIRARLLRG